MSVPTLCGYILVQEESQSVQGVNSYDILFAGMSNVWKTQQKIPHFRRLFRYRKCSGNFLFEFLTHFLYLCISPFQVISSFAGNVTFKNVKEYFVHISGTFPALIHATFPGNFHSCRKCHISWNWKCQGNFLVYISDTFPVLLHIILPSNFQLCRKFHNHILSRSSLFTFLEHFLY